MKNANSGPAVLSAGIEAREWNGCPIQRRQSDGFVNATAMCQATGKRWGNYMRGDRAMEYVAALAASLGLQIPCAAAVAQNRATGIPCVAAVAGFPASGIPGLIEVIKGGRPELQGTWIHPRLAVDLARWISPSFAVWMDGWFLEAVGVVAAPPAPQPAPRPRPQPQQARPQRDPLSHMTAYLPALVHQRWTGDPDANDIIRAIAQHLLLSCGPLPPVPVVEGAAVAWNRALRGQLGQFGAGMHW